MPSKLLDGHAPGSRVIAVIPASDYRTVYRRAGAHDVARSGPEDWYDAPASGAINVWGRDGWDRPDGRIHYTFYAERIDGRQPGELLEELARSPALLAVANDGSLAGAAVVTETTLSVDLAGCDEVFVVYEPGTHGGAMGTWSEHERWGRERDWTAAMAQQHFAEIYRKALGREIDPGRLFTQDEAER